MNFTLICGWWLGCCFSYSFLSGLRAFVSLRRGKLAHPDVMQNPPHSGRATRDVVVPLQVHRDFERSEVVQAVQPEDLLDHLDAGRVR
jgi:hypothetical protein